MKQVLWPKYLLGGMLTRRGAGTDEESQGFGRDLRGLVGRWPDADGLLEGGLSEGLRDWDLWYVVSCGIWLRRDVVLIDVLQGTANFLSVVEHVLVVQGEQGSSGSGLFGRLLDCLDRGGSGHIAN